MLPISFATTVPILALCRDLMDQNIGDLWGSSVAVTVWTMGNLRMSVAVGIPIKLESEKSISHLPTVLEII